MILRDGVDRTERQRIAAGVVGEGRRGARAGANPARAEAVAALPHVEIVQGDMARPRRSRRDCRASTAPC